MEEGIFLAKEPEEIGEIIDIRVVKRGNGGVIRELVIEGEHETYLIKTEYNIRYVLNDGVSSVTRMDGTTWFSDQLLPSAFFDLELITENERVTGYRIYGGGFGHGVGMSQNGARKMAEKGMNYEAILGFFYEGSQLKLAY
jgi:stage II sporulation protein D